MAFGNEYEYQFLLRMKKSYFHFDQRSREYIFCKELYITVPFSDLEQDFIEVDWFLLLFLDIQFFAILQETMKK